MPFVTIDGRKAYYARSGKTEAGLPIVAVHGAGGSHLDWPSALRSLPGHPVYTLDLPGHGRSEGDGRDTIDGYRAWLSDWQRELGLSPAVLLGHSMGSAIALSQALDEPASVAGLVLIGAGARLRVASTFLDLLGQNPPAATEMLIQLAYGRNIDQATKEAGRARLSETPTKVVLDDFLACDRFDLMGRLGEIKAPTLILCGEEDRMTPPKYARYLAEHIPHSEILILEGGGHMVTVEKTSEVEAAIHAFLERLSTHEAGG